MSTPQVTVSGSFRRFLPEIARDVNELEGAGVRVLSPSKPHIVGALNDFVFLEGDLFGVAAAVQGRHLHSIEQSEFLWLVAPGGYVGSSAAFEVAWAAAHGVPVLSLAQPFEPSVAMHVTEVHSLTEAIQQAEWTSALSRGRRVSVLMDPDAGLELVHNRAEYIGSRLRARLEDPVAADGFLKRAAADIRDVLDLL